jgi:predicted  nucleic acid-binding Zn-ribbon protein
MKEHFRRLWELQQLDNELRTLTGKLGGVPGRIADLTRAAEQVRAELDQAKADITEHKKQYKLAEVELKAAEEKIGSYSTQLYSAKTNEQYKAFLKEIEAQKKLKSGVEDNMIVLMEETEQLDRRVRDNEGRAKELETETARKVAMLEAERTELTAAIAEREAARNDIVASVPPELLKRYDRVRASKNGIAVASVVKDRCSACLSPVPAQRVLEVDRQDRLYSCEACGRILIVSQE